MLADKFAKCFLCFYVIAEMRPLPKDKRVKHELGDTEQAHDTPVHEPSGQSIIILGVNCLERRICWILCWKGWRSMLVSNTLRHSQ